MGFIEHLKQALDPSRSAQRNQPQENIDTTSFYRSDGADELEVVGEASYQSALWRLSHGSLGDRIRCDIVAVLTPEPSNPYDRNAIAVVVDGMRVGYLARETAARYLPGLQQLMSRTGRHVAVRGVIVGGGQYDDGPGRLGVWLRHDRTDFGLPPSESAQRSGQVSRTGAADGTMRTGFSDAWTTDAEDDSYDLSWFGELPIADRPAIATLRGLLAAERDPIDRHYQFAELESRLYRSRDLYETALDEFDDTCLRHDGEMSAIRTALIAKWGKVPLLEMYRQMAIRKQKQGDWEACVWWAERGLAVYGTDAAREDAVEDLLKRRNRAHAKLGVAETGESRHARGPGAGSTHRSGTAGRTEALVCVKCTATFERVKVPGRKPALCPDCR